VVIFVLTLGLLLLPYLLFLDVSCNGLAAQIKISVSTKFNASVICCTHFR
jgi:hypothetical protein